MPPDTLPPKGAFLWPPDQDPAKTGKEAALVVPPVIPWSGAERHTEPVTGGIVWVDPGPASSSVT
jgi:hypothetical protein